MSLLYDMCILCMESWQVEVREKGRREQSKNEIHSEKLYIKLSLAKWKRFSAFTKASVHIGKSITAATTTITDSGNGGSSIQVNELNVELCWMHTLIRTQLHMK